jgi:hypothetical protein
MFYGMTALSPQYGGTVLPDLSWTLINSTLKYFMAVNSLLWTILFTVTETLLGFEMMIVAYFGSRNETCPKSTSKELLQGIGMLLLVIGMVILGVGKASFF